MGPPGYHFTFIIPNDIDDIQEAVDSLPAAGGTIFIKADEYVLQGGIHIDRSHVAVIGEEGAVLKLGDHVNEPVILIGSDEEVPSHSITDVTVSNLIINGNMEFQDFEEDPDRTGIMNNGIDVNAAHNITIAQVEVHDARSGGIVVSKQSSRIWIDNCYLHDNYLDGIALYTSEDIQVTNFYCFDNGAAGLSMDNDLSHVIFSGGIIKNNVTVGIFARHSAEMTFSDIQVVGNHEHGCFISHEWEVTGTGVSKLLFHSCSFIGNALYGLFLDSPATDSPGNAVIGCVFSGNASGAIGIHPEGELYQEGNVILD